MLFKSIIFNILSNAVTLRGDKSILLSRIVNIITCFLLLLLFIDIYSLDLSLLDYNIYLIRKLNPYYKINVPPLLLIYLFMFFYTNVSKIFIGALIVLNTKFLLLNFFNKHKNFNFTLKYISKDKLACIFFTKIIAIPFVWIVLFSAYSLLEVNVYNFIVVVYITQLPLAYINNLTYQLYLKFLIINMSSYKIINNKLYITKLSYNLDFNLYNSNVVNRVNIYNLLSRLIIIFILAIAPISYIIIFAFIIILLIICYKYNLMNFTVLPSSPIQGGKPIQSSIPLNTATTLGLGTLIWPSISGLNFEAISLDNNIGVIKTSNTQNETLFGVKGDRSININQQDVELIRKSNMLKILERINIGQEHFYDENLDKEYISTNKQHSTVLAFKVFNEQTSCGVIYRSDINSNDYYPTYYTNNKSVSNVYGYLKNKFLINSNMSNNIIIFTQKISIDNSMYKVWRLSPEYDSFLFKLGKHLPKPASFDKPEEGVYKINKDNTHFDSLEVVNALNQCLDHKKKHFFGMESHYSGVYTEFLHYAKLATHVLEGEHQILGTKIDFLITGELEGNPFKHTYIERKSPSEQENMLSARNQSLRYICMDIKWPQSIKSVFGINTIGLNVEFNEYTLGNKGIVIIEDKYKEAVNKKVEVYSIISESNAINLEPEFSFNSGNRIIKGTTNFRLYQEYGSLDNKMDSKFINQSRIYQLSN